MANKANHRTTRSVAAYGRRYAFIHRILIPMFINSFRLLLIISLFFSGLVSASKDISMKEVREIAKTPVDEILGQETIEVFSLENYWKSVHGRKQPLIVFFYSNHDGPSQRVATLIKYLSPHYTSKISFARLKVSENGKPDKDLAKQLNKSFSLDSTPGILFYDNVNSDMILEDEDYIDADFKEFRNPSMFFWKTYYSAVKKELDALLAD